MSDSVYIIKTFLMLSFVYNTVYTYPVLYTVDALKVMC